MKNYKLLVPIALAALLLLSVYLLYDSRKTTEEEYQAYMTAAREYRAKGIAVDALANYNSAYELRPSAALAVELGEAYREAGDRRNFRKWGETILEEYPLEVSVYELLIDYYSGVKDYETCYELARAYRGRRLSSDKVESILKDITYAYETLGSYDEVGVFSNGLCAFNYDGRWGYVDADGSTAAARSFLSAGAFSSADLAPVVDQAGDAYFVDRNGNKKQVIQGVENLVELGYISGDTFPLYNGECWAFYNLKGEKLFGDYDAVSALANGVAAVEQDGAWMLINTQGEVISTKTYFSVVQDEKTIACRNDRLFVEDMEGFHLIDSAGNTYGQVYEDARLFNDNTLAAVCVDGKWGFVDVNGNLVIEPQYDDARSFSNGFAAVQVEDLWGFIDQTNTFVLEPAFKQAKDFSDRGSVFVRSRSYWELLQFYSYQED